MISFARTKIDTLKIKQIQYVLCFYYNFNSKDGHSKAKPFSTLFHSPFTFKVKFHYNSRHAGVKLKALVGVKPLKHE